MHYYNEHDKTAAAWLKELIAAGLIPKGEVDDRDIQNVRAAELVGYVQLHFFAGVGGWAYALRLAGWPEDRPIWTASLPCQPWSNAGQQRGEADERHLWPVFYELVKECKPSVCIGEQVSSKLGRQWFSRVRTDLEAVGYAVGASDLGAACIGSPHIRQRLYWVADRLADPDGERHDGVNALLREEERGRAASDLPKVAGCSTTSRMADLRSTGLAQRECDGRIQRETVERIQGQATIGDSGFSGLADTGYGKCRRESQRRPPSEEAGEWQQEAIQSSGCCQDRRLANADCYCDAANGSREESGVSQVNREAELGSWQSGRTGNPLLSRESCRLGDSMCQPSELDPRELSTTEARISRADWTEHGDNAVRPEHASSSLGAWDDYYLIPCADGKTRRVGTGIQPLAHGIPKELAGVRSTLEGMGYSPKEVRRMLRQPRSLLALAGRSRTIQLKGAGNAIVPQLAAEFIKAFMQVKEAGY